MVNTVTNATCPASLDSAFGPSVALCRRTFDFTQYFEEAFMGIVPAVFFIVAASLRLLSLYRAGRKAPSGTSLQITKLIGAGCYVFVQITLLIELSLEKEGRTRATIPAAALGVTASFYVVALSLWEHTHSIRPSIVLEIFLFFSLLLDVVRCRTLWLINSDPTATIMFTSSVALKTVLLGLEAHEKYGTWIRGEERSREETTGMFGQAFFSWLVALILAGYKKVLAIPDLYPLASEMKSENIEARFDHYWRQTPQATTKQLVSSLFKSLRFHAFAPIAPRLAMIAFTYCQPLLISRVLNFTSEAKTVQSDYIGYGLIAAYGIVYAGLALATAYYWFRVHRVTTMVRGVIAAKVFNKVNERSITNVDDSAALTLMSSDVERIMMGLNVVHESWSNLFEAAIGIYLLEQQIQNTAIISLGVAFLCAVAAGTLASSAGVRQAAWMEAIEKRISATAGMLGSMKSVKMLGFAEPVSAIIRKLRLEEIKSATRFRSLQITIFTLAFVPQTLAPVLTFTAYTVIAAKGSKSGLNVSRLFTSISILQLLAQQFTALFQSIPALVSAFACLGRVRRFMTSETFVDTRGDHRSLPPPPATDSPMEKAKPDNLFWNAQIRESKFPGFEGNSQKFSEPVTFQRSGDSIIFRNASFSWSDKADELVLENIDLEIKSNQLTMIVGPIASGKSTLLKAMLGELKPISGSVAVASRETGYCGQSPWLRNTTIRNNIINFQPFDQAWYHSVIRACGLESDFIQLDKGDQTNVGSGGMILSGGQKERISIARGIYARKPIAIFDDTMSGLDATTSRAVFKNCFSKDGILRRSQTTVVMATHAAHFLAEADHIIVLNREGQIAEQGSFQNLSLRKGGSVEKIMQEQENKKLGGKAKKASADQEEEGQGAGRRKSLGRALRRDRPFIQRNFSSDRRMSQTTDFMASHVRYSGLLESAIQDWADIIPRGQPPPLQRNLTTKSNVTRKSMHQRMPTIESIAPFELAHRRDSVDSIDDEVRSIASVSTLTWVPEDHVNGDGDGDAVVMDEKKGVESMEVVETKEPAKSKAIGDKKVYGHYLRATGVLNSILFVVYELLFVGLEYFPSVWLGWWSTSNENGETNKTWYYLGVYWGLQASFLIALYMGARHVAEVMVVSSGKALHEELLQAVVKAPMAYFTSTDTGETLNRFSQDLQLIDAELPIALLLFGASALGAVALSLIVLIASEYVGLAFVFVLAVLWFVQKFYLRTSRQLRHLDLEAKGPLYSLFIEALKGRETIRAYHCEDEVKHEYIEALDASQRPLYLLYSIQQWLTLVLGLIGSAIAVILVALMIQLSGSAGLGGVALTNMISLSSTLMSVVVFWTKLETSLGAVSRIYEASTVTPGEPEPIEATPPPESWPSRGHVVFNDMTATYKPDAPPALKGVNLEIAPGERIAICGRSGSGKSSLLSTLFRLIDPTSGQILIDGLDISQISPNTVRERLICLPQEPYFAPETVRFNADPSGNASDAEIETVLSELGIWDAVAAHAEGLDSMMETELLSHGQRQLFCLARTMLRSPHRGILVLDEATSSVDEETDALMQKAIRDKFPSQTMIVVAHRLNTIMDFHKVAVFDHGVLVELGNPQELVARGDTVFADLYKSFAE